MSGCLSPSDAATVSGRFLRVRGQRFLVRGVSYGTFAPDADGHQFPPRATVEFAPPTPPEQVLTVVESPQLRWRPYGSGFESECGRFSIFSQFKNGAPSFFAIDQHANTANLRLSPDCTEDEAKNWCEHRARFKVIFADGEERLATAEDLNGIEF